MVHKWLCLSCGGFDLVDVRYIQILVSRQSFFPRSLPYYLTSSAASSTAIFFSERGVFELAGPCAYCKLPSYQCFVSHLTSILLVHQLVLSQAHYDRRVPFIRRTTARCTTRILKHPGYWCYPGVESRTFTGAWAGRCVIAHLDDCWGPFWRSQASSHRTWHR